MNKKLTVYDCSVIELPKKEFPTGNLTPVQVGKMYHLI